jgi:hypothetical protein
VKTFGKMKNTVDSRPWQSVVIGSFQLIGRAGCDAKKNSLDADHLSVNRLAERRIKALTKAANGEELRQLLPAKCQNRDCIMHLWRPGLDGKEKVTAFAYPFAG